MYSSASSIGRDALVGEFSPAGRLPVTFYKSDDDLPDFENYDMQGRTYRYFEGRPLFVFGHGLTYTHFDYSELSVSKTSDGLTATLNVTNTGSLTSDEVVQLYASRETPEGGDPIRWLIGFQRVRNLTPDETRVVEISSPERWLALWSDAERRRIIAPGKLTISAGPSSDVASQRADIDL